MATERTHTPDDQVPYPDELDPPITEGDELPPITAEDIAHAVERLEAGRESGEYTGMRESDLAVLAYLTAEQWHAVKRDPSLLPRILTPTAHA
jgi:hypothetical protein